MLCIKNQNTRFILNNYSFEHNALYEVMVNIIVEPGKTQMTKWRMCIASGYLRLHIPIYCNVYCFSTATMIVQTRRNVTYVHCLSCLVTLCVY